MIDVPTSCILKNDKEIKNITKENKMKETWLQ